ncbi:MAG: DUF2934 domain-containing protein [Terriglobales bacterium]
MARKITQDGARRRKAVSVQTPIAPTGLEASRSVVSVSLEDEIRRRAYEIYLQRGGTPGNESEDWLVAEQEVRARQVHAGQAP